jgi:hypothetical protein
MQAGPGGDLDGVDRGVTLAHDLQYPLTLPVAWQAISSRPTDLSSCLVVHLAAFPSADLADRIPLYYQFSDDEWLNGRRPVMPTSTLHPDAHEVEDGRLARLAQQRWESEGGALERLSAAGRQEVRSAQ